MFHADGKGSAGDTMEGKLMSETLLTAEELPVGFEYSSGFIRFVAMEIFYLEPWFVLTGERLRTR